jgi:hypothetical protein
VYARRLYPLVARSTSFVTGLVPFSVAEVLLGIGLLLLGVGIVRRIRARGSPRSRVPPTARVARLVAAAAGVVLVFDLLWGFNYDREPVAALLGYDVSRGRTAELAALASGLLAESVHLRGGLPEDGTGALRLPDGRRGAMRRAPRAFDASRLAGRLPIPSASGRPKLVALSPLLSYLGISGIFIPFTSEASVNGTLPDWEIPFTACHELAHQRGFAREDEANYVGYLACRTHPDPDFRYSATFSAALYALAALRGVDREGHDRLRKGLADPLRRDLAALAAWRARYESRLGDVHEKVNDAYLKTQGQPEGVQSYGRMVDLLLAERRTAGWSGRR